MKTTQHVHLDVTAVVIEGWRELLHAKADLLSRDDSRDLSHQVVRLSDVHEIIDEATAAALADGGAE